MVLKDKVIWYVIQHMYFNPYFAFLEYAYFKCLNYFSLFV